MKSIVNKISESLKRIEKTAEYTGMKGQISLEYLDVDWKLADSIISELGREFKMHKHYVSIKDGLEVLILIG